MAMPRKLRTGTKTKSNIPTKIRGLERNLQKSWAKEASCRSCRMRPTLTETTSGPRPWANSNTGCWSGAAVQPPLALDRPYRTGYGSTCRSGNARCGQAVSTGSGDAGPHHRVVWDCCAAATVQEHDTCMDIVFPCMAWVASVDEVSNTIRG